MCLLTYLPAGTSPDLAALHAGAECNPDGHGFAIAAGTRLVVDKGLDGDAVIAAFDRARRTHPDGPALFHSRLRTHGRLTADNCHPFPVGGDPRTVIAHNGILPPAVRPATRDTRSDTRIAAEEFLPRFGPLHLRRTRLRLERWMGPDNLMALLTVDRRYRRNVYLFNEAAGIWHQGTWYSNDSFQALPRSWSRSYRYATPRWGSGPGRLGGSPLWCTACRAVIDPGEPWCPWCEGCWACGHQPGHCDCWPPAALTTPKPRHHGSPDQPG